MTWRSDTENIRLHLAELFIEHLGEPLSGEQLSREIGISRTAIWKHMEYLTEIGFQFDAAPRRGYTLKEIPDCPLQPVVVRYLKNSTTLGRQVTHRSRVHSTNTIASELLSQGAPHGTAVTADEQSGGRGRRGRSWISPFGGLWMSLLLTRPLPLHRAGEITLLAGVATARALEHTFGLPARIKWPNDILLHQKKICGILAEIRADGENVHSVILGIGMNVNLTENDILPELRNKASSLQMETGQRFSRAEVMGAILNEFNPMYTELVENGGGFAKVQEEWLSLCAHLGDWIEVQLGTERKRGLCLSIDRNGVLLMKMDNGQEIRVPSGEIVASETICY
ncbi:biotin--[acetyl-CoA-carboxylase] ligase [Alicyclobacillus tolerans]|uniref:Bifunctional ligase/repressor BirA n=2 Tax=Alicyclobacillus tolerans TaxID=90970 RepID=A0ABT9LVA7_9BACL|nr:MULTISPECIES: biotin--[acetyl-CoA-carboxylase] ligase [Alicyclobacillus]MDP9728158.1 BirA family biotin operon repressor/biotin-[acetyl-CoA-carboxylase] ligase [Alicyclobacillus tengchongensis]QRF23382.1 biotin--[acetyl-CoA-carboxylase] ligase [Alicyclobacillus sp. TC]SHJ85007.1 BirA family transcriptional regulator, biotin operon repressor / biotin-[acetyl-CoA-carboxylase] ligase [Alicyclobacillus montanus]